MPVADHADSEDESTPVTVLRNGGGRLKITRNTAVLAGLLMIVALLGVLHVTLYTTFSPHDEIQHFDTLEKNSRFVLIGRGELLSQETMRVAACQGLDYPWDLGSCDAAVYDHSLAVEQGWNTAYTSSPLYYVTTGIAGRTVKLLVPGIDSLLTASRLAGLAWALVGATLLWLLLGEFSIPINVRFFAILLLATSPTVLQMSSVVNPDVTGIVGGAAVALLVVRWERGASPAWMIGVVAALTVLGKPLNAAAVGAMVVYLVIRYFQRRRASDSGRPEFPIRGIAAVVGGIVVGAVPWLMVQSALATVPALDVPMIRRYTGTPITLRDLTEQFDAVVTPLRDPYLAEFLKGPLTVLIAVASNLVLLGTNLGVALLSNRRRASALAATTLTAAVLLGPTVMLFMYVTMDGMLIGTAVRYGLPFLPLFAVGLAVAAAEKLPGRIALGVLSTASLAVVLTEMVGLM